MQDASQIAAEAAHAALCTSSCKGHDVTVDTTKRCGRCSGTGMRNRFAPCASCNGRGSRPAGRVTRTITIGS